jgi:hypothetical protein
MYLMPTINEVIQISSQFDAQLVTLGEWSIGERRLLNNWLEQTSNQSKGRVAANIIASMVLDYLKDDLSVEGRVRIKRIRKDAALLEQLVFTTRELTKKFYRDHINHMLKVSLLARAIALKKPFCLKVSELNLLVLACLFHDIAYPLSECGRIFSEALKSFKDCYSSAELFSSKLIKESKVDITSLSHLIGEEETKLKTALRKLNHGLLSAIEFKDFLKNQKSVETYSAIIRAIALHDSEFKTPIDTIKDPIVGLLVLADELQDWGRPTDQEVAIIPRIEDFELKDGKITGVFNAESYANFSVLKQISSKMKNLSRLFLDSNQLKFEFKYNIKGFEKIDHENFQGVLETLFNSVDKRILNPADNMDLSESAYFEKSFFGLEITMRVKQSLYRKLKNGKISKGSIFEHINIYLNADLSEMILSDKPLGELNSIVLTNENQNQITAKIVSRDKKFDGNIYSSIDEETMEFSRFLAAEIRFINYMTHEIGCSKVDDIQDFPKLEGIAEPAILEKVGIQLGNDFLETYKKLKLKSVLGCLKNQGCFLFK